MTLNLNLTNEEIQSQGNRVSSYSIFYSFFIFHRQQKVDLRFSFDSTESGLKFQIFVLVKNIRAWHYHFVTLFLKYFLLLLKCYFLFLCCFFILIFCFSVPSLLFSVSLFLLYCFLFLCCFLSGIFLFLCCIYLY